MTQHTPGPWDVEVEEPAQHVIRANWSSEQYPIARLIHAETRNADANARLIAQAPAMLDAVQVAHDTLEDIIHVLAYNKTWNANHIREWVTRACFRDADSRRTILRAVEGETKVCTKAHRHVMAECGRIA